MLYKNFHFLSKYFHVKHLNNTFALGQLVYLLETKYLETLLSSTVVANSQYLRLVCTLLFALILAVLLLTNWGSNMCSNRCCLTPPFPRNEIY